MSSIIELNQVCFTYDNSEKPALNGVDLNISSHEWVAVLGRNGSGKSTFGRLLNGLLIPTAGSVLINGHSTADEKLIWSIRTSIGMVFQNPDHQFVATTVNDDLAFGLENLGLPREVMQERIDKYADLIGITHLLEAEPHRLSGGQKQRVAIAGVMAMEPEVIIFDESTSMLDPVGRNEVMNTLKMLHERGMTIISITHDMDEAMQADRILTFHNGEVIKDCSPIELFSSVDLLKELGLSLPFSVDLQNELQKRGVILSDISLTEEELIAKLWTLYSMK
ncbi:energy-coupling factor transporter ATPase [Halalkalibacter krulwichiae]|uniref:Energy-coupling factor transporter ATP-binding protein EcfA1 n=1 Tax=Halalkalibacter krulwichiae TaxID=199441 RepID=A0A1X9M784_9BACI|nr:energy-coupling factor transporter ATPase [Halalkalibacter krulwichiae]ARK28544.1 Energy-coupling factor transporter ATP-binding protein EcfA1 [Halalkalibacter krulwichiae]